MDSSKLEFVNTRTTEKLEIGLPQDDLEEFFAQSGRYNDFLNNNFTLDKLLGGELDFLEYDKHTELSKINNAFLEYEKLDESTRELVLLITHLLEDTLDSLVYALRNYEKYLLVPEELGTNDLIAEFAIKTFTERNFLCYFCQAIDYNRFCQELFSNGIAYKINNRILIKRSMIV